LIVTCASKHSRNRKAGMLMGQGKTMDEAMKEAELSRKDRELELKARELEERAQKRKSDEMIALVNKN